MNTGKNSLINRFIAGIIFIFFWGSLSGQDCFSINMAKSKIILNPAPHIDLPDHGDTVKIPCTKAINNFSIVVDFYFNAEQYFEDTIQMVATLMYKGTTYIMVYDRTGNAFKLLNDPPNLGAGNYLLTVTSTNCIPASGACNNCLVTHSFDILFDQDTNLNVSITSNPTPPILSCLPNSTVTLSGPPSPNNGFKMQWARLAGDEFIKIIGANTNTYVATQSGTYQYILSGPGGCAGTNIMTVSPPQLPKVVIFPDTQKLNACTQEIKGVDVSNFGGNPANVQYTWTASNNGVIKSGETSPNPVISAPGTYKLLIRRTDNGCTATAAVNVILGDIQLVTLDILKDPNQAQLDCRTSEIRLIANANLSSGTSGFNYTWSTGSTSPEIKVNAPGTYSVTATSLLNGCQNTASTNIIKNLSKPILSIQASRDTVCPGEPVFLTAIAQKPGEYKWNDGTPGNVNTAMPAMDGDNWYSVTVTANDNGCTNSASKSINRMAAPTVICAEHTVTVENGARRSIDCHAGADALIWVTTTVNVQGMPALGEGVVQDQVYKLIEGRTPGTVLYYFYAKNAGCTSERADMLVHVLPKTVEGIFIPELITPNGDGVNDTWDIVLPEAIQDPEAYQLNLFSRNGAKVYSGTLAMTFQANDYPDGTYYYLITKPDGDSINGAVTILRRQ